MSDLRVGDRVVVIKPATLMGYGPEAPPGPDTRWASVGSKGVIVRDYAGDTGAWTVLWDRRTTGLGGRSMAGEAVGIDAGCLALDMPLPNMGSIDDISDWLSQPL